MALHDVTEPLITTIEHDNKRLKVTCRIAFDGIEYVGRLWFTEEADAKSGIPDRGALPGRNRDEVLSQAQRLTPPEFALRYRRAVSERRRFFELRKATEDVLQKIRYLNQVAISMRAGLLDQEGAAQELEMTEKQLYELIERLKASAGVEGAK